MEVEKSDLNINITQILRMVTCKEVRTQDIRGESFALKIPRIYQREIHIDIAMIEAKYLSRTIL
jgi:hypothetical protein